MPRKHAANAAGHEMPPVASNKPAPTAATSSNTNVARKNPAAFANEIHSATADGENGRASVISRTAKTLILTLSRPTGEGIGIGGSPLRFILMLERGRCDAESWRHLQSHDTAHDADERIVMYGMGNGIHDFPPDGGGRNLRAISRIAGFARHRQRTHEESGYATDGSQVSPS